MTSQGAQPTRRAWGAGLPGDGTFPFKARDSLRKPRAVGHSTDDTGLNRGISEGGTLSELVVRHRPGGKDNTL